MVLQMMLEIFHRQKLTTLTWRPRALTESDDREEYEVEAIIGHEMIRGTPYYRVKWQGWPRSANTWEPIDNLGQCKDLIKAG